MSYFEAQPRQARGQLTSALSSAFESEVASMFAAGVAFRASNQITSPVERFPQTFRQNRRHSLLVGTERLGTLSLSWSSRSQQAGQLHPGSAVPIFNRPLTEQVVKILRGSLSQNFLTTALFMLELVKGHSKLDFPRARPQRIACDPEIQPPDSRSCHQLSRCRRPQS